MPTKSRSAADKARDNYKTVQNQRVKLSDDEFRVKLNAEAHIDELAEISTSKPQKAPDSKNHSFAKDGFTYRTAYFEDFDGKYYRVTLSIGNNGTVATIYNVGEIKENVPSSAKIIAVMGSKALDETFSDISIPQNQKKSTVSGKKISNGRSALPKTDKNSAKQGTSTVADADKIEVSRGQYEKMKANLESDKVYSKREVVETLDAARGLLSKKEGRSPFFFIYFSCSAYKASTTYNY